MVDAVTLQTISVVIAAASVVFGMMMGVEQLRRIKNTRRAELIMQLYNQFTSNEFTRQWLDTIHSSKYQDIWDNLDEHLEKGDLNIEFMSDVLATMNMYNGVGVLVRNEVADPKIIFDFFSPAGVLISWEKIEPIIQDNRKTRNDPTLWDDFEYLYNEVIKRFPYVKSPYEVSTLTK